MDRGTFACIVTVVVAVLATVSVFYFWYEGRRLRKLEESQRRW
jgi:hypothetical protein